MTNWKTKLVFLFLICFSVLLFWRLYYLQIEKREYYKVLALGQQVFFDEFKGERGKIFFSDNQTLLAKTERKNIVYLFPQKIPQEQLKETIAILSEILKEKKENLAVYLKENRVFKKEISVEILKEIESKKIKGVSANSFWGRIYPQKKTASHIAGFTNTEGQGQYGVEVFYDEFLKGGKKISQREKAPFGYFASLLTKDNEMVSLKGADVILTLDYKLQYFSEKLLEKAKELWDIDSGQIVVINPKTGEILSLAVWPNFDPNHYQKEKNLKIFLNPVSQNLFEPGSVLKPITMAAGLEESLVAPETTYIDEGYVKIMGRPIYNFDRRTWGEQSMTDVLEHSINTGAVFVQQKLGQDFFLKHLTKSGLFEKTGIDLPGEIFSENKNLTEISHPRTLATASFGQGIEITPIQLLRTFSAFANGGNLIKPFAVKKIIKANGEIIENQPQIQKRAFSKKTAETIASMLVSVIENGAAQQAKIPGYFIAGKTGTAQVPLKDQKGYSESETIHSFIAFFPAFEPKFLIFIKLDNPKKARMSSHSAVPLGHDLIKYIIDSWQIPPDNIK